MKNASANLISAEPEDIVSETLSRYRAERASDAASISWLMPLMFAPILADDAFAAARSESLLDDWSAADDVFAAFEAGAESAPAEAAQVAPRGESVPDLAELAEPIDLLGEAVSLYAVDSADLFGGGEDALSFLGDAFAPVTDTGFTSAIDTLALAGVFDETANEAAFSVLIDDAPALIIGDVLIEGGGASTLIEIAPLDGDFI